MSFLLSLSPKRFSKRKHTRSDISNPAASPEPVRPAALDAWKDDMLDDSLCSRIRTRASHQTDFSSDSVPSIKRVNSKESILIRGSASSARLDSLGSFYSSNNQSSSRLRAKSLPPMDLNTLEEALANPEKLDRAILAAQQAHCAEGLEFLRELRLWEALEDADQKLSMLKRLQEKFFEDSSPKEVCLPKALRQRLVSNEMVELDLQEAKRHIIKDIRFNEAVIEAILIE